MPQPKIIGVDEAGRGPLAGPVVASACCFLADCSVQGLADSKQLSGAQRKKLLANLYADPTIEIGVGMADPDEIDRINILQATFLAMRRAIHSLLQVLKGHPVLIIVDGRDSIPGLEVPQKALIRADQTVREVQAASIVAKETRDHWMQMHIASKYAGYGFESHVGYPTERHRDALKQKGPTPVHRRTFQGVVS